MKNNDLKIIFITIGFLIYLNIFSQDMYVTKVTGEVSLSSTYYPISSAGATVHNYDDYDIDGVCTSCDKLTYKYTAVKLAKNKQNSVEVSASAFFLKSGSTCGELWTNLPEKILYESADSYFNSTSKECGYSGNSNITYYSYTWELSKPTYSYQSYNKLEITSPEKYVGTGADEGFEITITDITNYPVDLGNVVFEVGKVNSEGNVNDADWEERPLNIFDITKTTDILTYDEIRKNHNDWKNVELKIRLKQKNGYVYPSNQLSIVFLDKLIIAEPSITPDCESTADNSEGSIKVVLQNALLNSDNKYDMAIILYEFSENATCESPVKIGDKNYCKGIVKKQNIVQETSPEIPLNNITKNDYLMEVVNKEKRTPAYQIVRITTNTFKGDATTKDKYGTYDLASCNDPTATTTLSISGENTKENYSYSVGSLSGTFDNLNATEEIELGPSSGHTITFKDGHGCESKKTLPITKVPDFSCNIEKKDDITCNGFANGSLKFSTSGGFGNNDSYTYTVIKDDIPYSNYNRKGDILQNLSTGTYRVSITDESGCKKEAPSSITFSQPPPITFTATPTTPECYNGNGSIAFTHNGGTPNYKITITDNSTNTEVASYSNTPAGGSISDGVFTGGKTYTVKIIDANKCDGETKSIPIPNPPEIKFDELEQSKPSDCVASLNGEATFKVSNLFERIPSFYNENKIIIPTENLNKTSDGSYLWTGLGVGISQIQVKAGNCYSLLGKVTINQKQDQISLTFDPSPADCETKDNGSINVNVLNGVLKSNEYTYVLTKESGISTTAETSDATYTFSSLQGNRTYSFSVTDGVGCVATAEKGVPLDPNRIQLNTLNSENAFCSGNPSGKITASRVSGTGYGSITYTLQGENAIGTGDNDNYTFSGLVPGKYTVQALDNSNSCYATKTVDVIANPNPISIIFSDTVHQSCNEITNGQMRITASSIGPNNNNYGIESIYNGTLNVKTESNTILYQNQEAVTYNFTVVDKNKCTASGAFRIKNLNNNPTLKVNSIDSLFCANDKTGVIRFKLSQKWRKPAYKFYLNGILNPTDSIFSNRSAKNDTILVVDADGCPGDTIMNVPVLANTIRFNPNPYFTHASCMAAKNGTITVKADKGFPFENGNYKYSINTGETVLGKVAVFDSLEAGKDYVVSVSDAKDCILTYDQIPIRIIDNPLALSSPNTTNATCIEKATGRMIVSRLYGTPFKKGFKFDINDSTGTTVSTQNSGFSNVLFTGLKQGRYNVVVSDTNKCSVSQPFTIGYNPLFEVNSVKPFRVPKFGTRGGMVRAVASLGNAGFDYKFFQTGGNGSNSAVLLRSGTMKDTVNIRNLYTGTYIIHIKDTADCVIDENTGNIWFIDTVLVSQPESELALQVSSLKNVACYGDSTASIQLSAQGGYPEYRYAIKEKVNFQREPLFGHLPIGTYELFVRDDADIDTSILVTVTQPSSPLTPSLAGTNRTSCFNYSDGKASLSITGGTSPYTVSLDSVRWQSDPVLVGLKANKYTALVKDANNCFARLPNIMVTQPDSITVSSQTITSTPCLKNEGAINVTGVAGGNGDYSYVWYKKDSVLGNQSILSNLYSGRYKLRITDKDGCKGDTAFFVSDISNIWVNFNTTPINCWGKANGKAELTVVKGALPITSVEWPGKPISMFATTELDSGLHRVVITDNERCQKDTTFTINTISRLSIPEVWRNNPLCLGRSDGSLRVEAAGGNAGYSYNWGKYGSRNEITDLLPGIYNVSVTDANNCVRAFDLTLDYQKVEKPRLGRDLVLCSRSDYILNPGNYLQYNWTLNNKAISTDSVFVVTQPGTYVVNVKSDEQCLGSDTLNVDFSNEELVSDFLMTTQAYAGDTIMLVEISRPIPDSVTWVLSTGSKLIDYGQYFKQISLPDTGIYKYAMIAHYKGCSDMVEKYVEVISPDGSVSKKKSATDDLFNSVSVYPNPSSGQFTVEVVLKRKSDLLMKIINLGTGITKYIRSSKGSDVYTENFSLNLTPGMHVLYLQAGKSSRTVNIMVR